MQPPVKAESEAGVPGCEDKVEGPVLRAHLGHPQLGAQTALVILQRITGESHRPPMQEIETVPRQWPRTSVSAVGSDPGPVSSGFS